MHLVCCLCCFKDKLLWQDMLISCFTCCTNLARDLLIAIQTQHHVLDLRFVSYTQIA